jgi:hypothetical protein
MMTTRKGRARGRPLPEEIEVLERHAQALDRFRRALCGLDREDRIALAHRILAENDARQDRRSSRSATGRA